MKKFRKYPFLNETIALESRDESIAMLFNRFSNNPDICEYLNESAGYWQNVICQTRRKE